jgi:Fe-S oxidoreductase
MCPSYRVTGEEKYSTRGRSRLFGEMLRGEVVKGGWQSEAVKEALDLCLSCKGCKSDCPTHTDMASYKAEFLYHYHQRNRRPVQAWSMGFIHRWARLASKMPRLVNWFTQTPGLNVLAKQLAGIALQRDVPKFAARTFRQWFAGRAKVSAAAASPRRVILWADTFNNHFHPETAMAAVKVLEHAGYEVSVPQAHLCCGRPLYDFGLLDQAERQLREIMQALAADIEVGTPIVGLEPACVAVFRDELLKLFPDDPRAGKLALQVRFITEFLVEQGVSFPGLEIDAIVHGHCHQKSVIGMGSDNKVLDAMGVRHTMVESSCCGMSGSFGFDPKHYDLSVKAAELSLLPALRACGADTTVVSNGFSCREQIAQLGDRRAVHIVELMAEAIDRGEARAARSGTAGGAV